MVKVIEHGKRYYAFENKEIKCECTRCNCIFTASFKDFNYSQVHSLYVIQCPECPNVVYVPWARFTEN